MILMKRDISTFGFCISRSITTKTARHFSIKTIETQQKSTELIVFEIKYKIQIRS